MKVRVSKGEKAGIEGELVGIDLDLQQKKYAVIETPDGKRERVPIDWVEVITHAITFLGWLRQFLQIFRK